jgi:hypothetical protein
MLWLDVHKSTETIAVSLSCPIICMVYSIRECEINQQDISEVVCCGRSSEAGQTSGMWVKLNDQPSCATNSHSPLCNHTGLEASDLGWGGGFVGIYWALSNTCYRS